LAGAGASTLGKGKHTGAYKRAVALKGSSLSANQMRERRAKREQAKLKERNAKLQAA
jgi:hypothetical protein